MLDNISSDHHQHTSTAHQIQHVRPTRVPTLLHPIPRLAPFRPPFQTSLIPLIQCDLPVIFEHIQRRSIRRAVWRGVEYDHERIWPTCEWSQCANDEYTGPPAESDKRARGVVIGLCVSIGRGD
jgi:hypothetical protein